MLRTIRSRLYLLVALVSTALVALGAYGGWRASRARVETELLSNLELARAAAAAVDVWVADVVHESRILGRAVSGDRLEPAEAERLLGEAVRDSGAVRDYAWVSPTGLVLVSSDPRLLGVSGADRPELRRLQAGDEVAVGDVTRDPLDGAPVVTVATAIRDGSGLLAGALLATVAPDRLATRVLPARGDDGSAALIDRAGVIVAQLPEARLSWEDRRAAGTLDLVRAALAGAEATGSVPEGGRRERLAAAVPVKSLGWVVRASQPGAAVLGPLRREIALGVMAAGLLSLAALVAFGSLGTRSVAALRRLEQHAKALGRGKAVVPLQGPTEVVSLARTYQEMAEHLGTARRRFQAVFEDAPVGVVILEPHELRVRYANRTYLSFLDEPFRSAGVTGKRLEEFLPRAGELGLPDLARRVQEGELPPHETEYRYDGFARGPTWWRGSLRPVTSEDGGTDLVMVVTEVTEQVRAREQVEADRRRLETVLATLPAGVIIADAGGQMVQVNDAARRIWGTSGPFRPASIFRERRARWADSGEELRPRDWPLHRALRGDGCTGELVEIDRFDGAQATIVISAAPFRDGDGRISGAVSAFLDVTELRRAVRNRDEMLQVVSHDLRTPLATVTLGAAALGRLQDGPTAATQARRSAERIAAAGARMARLIDDLLDLEGLEDGRLSIRTAPCDPTDLLGEAADQLREAARQKGLDLCLSAVPGLPSVACDRDRILQVLGNVASNAVKATDRGAVCLAAEAQGDAVVFRVRDTGPGIPEDELPHVFDRYRRGSGARWRGAGLGLAIARALVEAHGGRIWAESQAGTGTSVTFTLPAVEGAGAELAAGTA